MPKMYKINYQMQKGLEHSRTDVSEMKQKMKSKIIHLAFDKSIYQMLINSI